MDLKAQLLTCILLLYTVGLSQQYTDPVLKPESVTDSHGNSADGNNTVTWGTYSARLPYVSTVKGQANLQLPYFYGLVDGFTKVVQPQDPTFDIVAEVLATSSFDFSGNILTLLRFGGGILACFVIGILLIICSPLVGCCFCCCRLCGRCGGKLYRNKLPKSRCRCRTHTIILFITCSSVICSIVFVYMTNTHTGNGLGLLADATENNLDDVVTYLTNLEDEATFITLDGFDFTSRVIQRDLDNIEYLLGLPFRESLDTAVRVSVAVDMLVELDDNSLAINSSMAAYQASRLDLKEQGRDLKDELSRIQSDLRAVYSQTGCASSCQALVLTVQHDINIKADFGPLPPLSRQMEALDTAIEGNLKQAVLAGKENFDRIPERVKNDTQDVVSDMTASMDDFRNDIVDSLDGIIGLQEQVNEPLSKLQSSITGYSNLLKSFDKFRFYGCVGLTTLLCLVVLLQVVGTIGGACTFDDKINPSSRSPASHRFGNCLMASVGLTLVFYWLLMILVTFPFLVGVVLDRDVCDQIKSPEFKILRKFVDVPKGGLLGDGYVLGDAVLGNSSIPLTITGFLEACRANKSAYLALSLQESVNISQITDYESIDLGGSLQNITVGLDDIKLINSNTSRLLQKYRQASNINFPNIENILEADTVAVDFNDLADAIRAVANDGSNTDPAKANLISVASDLDTAKASYVRNTSEVQDTLLSHLTTLKAVVSNVNNLTHEAEDILKYAEAAIPIIGPDHMIQLVPDFQDRILGVVIQLLDRVTDGITNQMGACYPVWNIWASVVEDAVCTQFLLPFNGFWFSLGWCLCFMFFTMIFSVRLAKYLRRMEIKKTQVFPKSDEERKAPAGWNTDTPPEKLSRQPSAPPPYHPNMYQGETELSLKEFG